MFTSIFFIIEKKSIKKTNIHAFLSFKISFYKVKNYQNKLKHSHVP